MKIENEIIGHVKIHTSSRLKIELWIKDEQIDSFMLDLEAETIEIHVEKSTRALLGMRQVYEDYIKLIADLGLKMSPTYKRHWTPTLKDGALWCYFVNSVGEIEGNWLSNSTFNNKLVANFNRFPTRGLAEKGKNLSKLGRLVLLWQYANDCIFETDWKNNSQRKHFIKHDHINNTISCNFSITAQLDIVYFETAEQVEAFIEMYETEILRLLGVKS